MALPSIDVLTIVLVMVVLSRIFGELLSRKRQSPIVGEILVGILLGPYILRLVDPTRDILLMAEINGIAQLGIFFLIFHAGLELSMKELGDSIRKSFPVVFGGLAIPFLMSTLILLFLGFDVRTAFFIGLCLSLTALPVSVRVLTDLGRFNTVAGRAIVATAVGNDVGSLAMLAVLLDLSATGQFSAMVIGFSILKITIFLVVVYIFARLLLVKTRVDGREVAAMRHYLDRVTNALHSKESVFAIAILFVLAFGGLAVLMGLHFVIGAFFGAVLICRELLGRKNYKKVGGVISAVAMGFIAPIFFVYIGLSFYVEAYELLYYVPVFIVIYLGTKSIGGYLGGRAMGLPPATAKVLAVGIANPGTMEIIIANIGYEAGLITMSEFSMIVLMVMVIMLSMPIYLKRVFESAEQAGCTDVMEPVKETASGRERSHSEEVIEVREYEELPPRRP